MNQNETDLTEINKNIDELNEQISELTALIESMRDDNRPIRSITIVNNINYYENKLVVIVAKRDHLKDILRKYDLENQIQKLYQKKLEKCLTKTDSNNILKMEREIAKIQKRLNNFDYKINLLTTEYAK